jgi:hypothetical protein
MTIHPASGPIRATFLLRKANAHLVATDRDDTTVEVRPTDPHEPSDVRAAEDTMVELTGDTLRVVAPEQQVPGDSESIDVAVRLPAGSSFDLDGGAVRLRTDGRLGDCRLDLGAGAVRLGRVARASIGAGSAEVVVVEATGDVSVHAGSNRIDLQRVEGSVSVESASGAVELGAVDGPVRVTTASGRVTAKRAGSSIEVRSATGAVELDTVVEGRIRVETSAGNVVVGIAPGTAARLDLASTAGRVDNRLDPVEGPRDVDRRVEVEAVTRAGDITIRRSAH